MSDPSTQEVAFSLGGKDYRLRPTFRILARIETTLNQPARTLGVKCYLGGVPQSERGGNPEISLVELSSVLAAMLADTKDPPTIDKVGDILMEEGYSNLLLPIGNFLTRAQRGNKIHEEEILARREKEAAGPGAEADPPPTLPET